MSWVTDVLLLFSLGEVYWDEEDPDPDPEPLPLKNINAWLAENNYRSLNNLHDHVNTGKSMQAFVYGGAYNFLKIKEFLETVKAQDWKEPENVQLLIQDEQDERFTLYNLSDKNQT